AFAEQPLHPLDRVAVLIKALPDPAQEDDILRPVIAPAAAPFQRLHLSELRFPETQHVLRDFELLGDLADRPECGCRLGRARNASIGPAGHAHPALLRTARPLVRLVLMLSLRTCEARKTRTRRG